jgi:two-component system, OmpR family, sensor histidine kinase KdpD
VRPGGYDWRTLGSSSAIVVASLAVTTAAVFVLQESGGVRDASTLFLLAVALVAYLRGSWASVATAVGAFLTYNFLFLPPRFTFFVADAQHILTLILLLVVGVGIGRLTGLQRDQAVRSERREREARALSAVSRAIASAETMREALPAIIAGLASDARMQRVWVGIGPTWAQEQVVASTDAGAPVPGSGPHSLLRRAAETQEAGWVRLSPPGPTATRREGLSLYRIELADGDDTIGSLWAARDPRLGQATAEETRLLAAAADQIGQGIKRDRLAAQANELEVARRSDELKAALLDSVSHDLRTPLAAIRATAGTMADPAVALPPETTRTMAREIDFEADRLARLVGGLLDMSRIAGGALETNPEPIPVSEVVEPGLRRLRESLGSRPVEMRIPEDLPPVAVDPVLANQVIDNLLENVGRHTPPDARVRVSAQRDGQAVRLRVEDSGGGVPPDAMAHLFEKFFRVPARRGTARHGTGLGLAVVQGLAEAMGGSVAASPSELGGLAIDVWLPVADLPPP